MLNEVLHEFIREKTAKDLWEKLKSLYMMKNLTSKYVVKHRLHMRNMAEDLIDKELSGDKNSLADGLIVRGKSTSKGSSSDGRSRSKSKSKHSNLTCNYYKKKGHNKVDYFKLQNKNKERNQKDENLAKASVANDKEKCDVYVVTDYGTSSK
ncbi:hypothetical protein GH714_020370 [Hevea brasiliensis]|uniref:Zinc finger, CCHC-type n=1 Tax=Hevea brasiliensis TaxID=3981 RepID=A0A6A6KWC8_HEVBR|nr:hypothetical protein GH714_020370 [Hevea brasiliensis]